MPDAPDRRHLAAAAALLALAVLALYARTLGHPPVFDDATLTEEFLRGYAGGFRLDLRRLSYGSFGWVHALAGPDLAWQRAANALLHVAVALALAAFVHRLLGALVPAIPAARRAWLAAGGAALFALHPVAAYGVAYLMQRSIVMATLFSLLALGCLLEGLLRRSRRWHLVAVAAYGAAVFSKEHAVMLPAVALALGVLVRGGLRPALRELWLPLALMAAIAVCVTLLQRGVLGAAYEPFAQSAVARLAESRDQAAVSARAAGGDSAPSASTPAGDGRDGLLAASVVNQGWLFLRYAATWALPWPGWMSVDLRPPFPASALAWPQSAGFLAWLAWPLAAGGLLLRGGRAGLAGFALLAPWLLSLTEFVAVRLAEPFVLYRSYLWMALAPLAAVAAIAGAAGRRAAWAAAAAALAVLAAIAHERIGSFGSETGLWNDAVAKLSSDTRVPLADRTVRYRGVARFRAGDDAGALADFERAIAIAPREAENWLARGTLLMRHARSAEALADFERALRLEPRMADALERRCVVLLRLGRLPEALADCERAKRLSPHVALNHTSLGMAFALSRRASEAEAAYREALALAPSSPDTRYQYGVLLAGTGRAGEARAHWDAACARGHRAACARLGGAARP